MTRTYTFGPVIEPSGVRFRLWAPESAEAAVVVDPGLSTERRAALRATADGWHEALVEGAKAGSRYAFDILGHRVPDPASRFQPDDVLGPSEVVDLAALPFAATDWRGRPWAEAVTYELHVGTFTTEGTFAGVEQKLAHLRNVGITALELMPLADFAGRRNWGYDGVLPYAPDSAYGRPEDLARLVDAAHRQELMVFLDVVYNHFGPEGNFLGLYAPPFFTDDWHTPWGQAIDFRRAEVRRFFIENACYWLEAYRLDGLRLDAVHAINDPSTPDVLTELAGEVRSRIGSDRHVHLILENDANEARRLGVGGATGARVYDAQWNDDFHHIAHHLVTGEAEGYYVDFASDAVAKLGRALAEGFIFQGDPSAFRDGEVRGEPSDYLPPTAFVNFVQNHDQIGNRAFGERLTTLADEDLRSCFVAILLLAPQPPLLFMGEEWGSRQPFLYFTDFHDELAKAVRDGRRREFARFPAFSDPEARERIPDPNSEATFQTSKLDWASLETEDGQHWLERYRTLLELRAAEIAPIAAGLRVSERGDLGEEALSLTWADDAGHKLTLVANLATTPLVVAPPADARLLHASKPLSANGLHRRSAAWWRSDASS